MSTRQERIARRQRQQKIRNVVVGAGAFLLVIAIVFLLTSKAPAQVVGPAKIGQPLSDFSLTDINGQAVHLRDYAGQVVLVNAWAIWCPPCKAEMPDLNAYYQAHQKDGFVLLAVNAGDTLSQASAFAEQARLAFPVLLDEDLRVLNGLGIHSFPTSIIVGQDGVVKGIHQGMFSPESLETEITPLLSSQ
jgi:cytochrome c biogenesis protein CcmG, thiol:disulfide interchange protein DsbE